MSKITFKNKCNVPSWMPEVKKKFRKEANEYFTNALLSVPLLKDQNLEVTYFLEGVGSIVAKIVSSTGETYVMKTTETVNHTNGEICTYKATTDAGIKVPKLFYDGIHNDLPFLIMEYFDTGTLSDKLKDKKITLKEVAEIKSKFFCDLKKVEGQGYGWPVRYEEGILKGNFQDIVEFVDTWFCKKGLLEVAQKHMPSISWEKDLEYHSNKTKEQNVSGVCKLGTFDFQTGHVFASNPPTLFDPCARLEPEYFDLAQLIIPFLYNNKESVFLNKDVFAQYQANFGPIDADTLLTAVWLQTYRKATNQLLNTDERRTQNGMHALGIISNTDLLKAHIERFLG